MAKRVDVSYESLRQEGREEVLDWLLKNEVISYSKPENKYFVWNRDKEWLLFLPWEKDSK
jgi:hypothetical protein